jgi:hypothetical protein
MVFQIADQVVENPLAESHNESVRQNHAGFWARNPEVAIKTSAIKMPVLRTAVSRILFTS